MGTKAVPSKKRLHRAAICHAGAIAFGLAGLACVVVSACLMLRPLPNQRVMDSGAMATIIDKAEMLRSEIVRAVRPAIKRTALLAVDPRVIAAMRSGNRDSAMAACNEAVTRATEIDAFAIFDAEGKIVAINSVYATGAPIAPERVDSILNRSFEGREIITSCIRNDSDEPALEFQTTCDITPAFFDSTGLSIAYSVPIRDPDTRARLGVASARLRFERLSSLLETDSHSAAVADSIQLVTDAGGYFSEEINSGRRLPPVAQAQLREIVSPLVHGTSNSTVVRLGDDYVTLRRIGDFRTLDGGGIQVMLVGSVDRLSQTPLQARALQAGVGTVVGCLLLLLASMARAAGYSARARVELAAARDAAELASRTKSEFLANMSHEIRTPLTAIMGYSELLNESPALSEQSREYARTIHTSGEHLLTLVSDILDLSKIEAGRMNVESAPCDPRAIVSEVVSVLHARAEAKGTRIEIDCPDSVPGAILTDPTRLRQVLVNLVGNAVKFTDSGSVRIVCSFDDSADPPRLAFDVIDTGIGMTAAQAAGIFQPFTQADASTTRRFGGTGLGLTISRKLAQLLAGDVVLVRAEAGAGATFRASIAATPAEAVEQRGAPAAPGPCSALMNAHVLLVEDSADNQRLLSFILRQSGAHVELAPNGLEGVRAARAAADQGNPFHIILMDMQMPEMDGFEATRRLRAMGMSLPIIALTASALAEDRAQCMAAGCNAFAAKPIKRAVLLELVAAWLKPVETAQAA